MMTQGLLPFQYEAEKNESQLTAFAGLPLYLEMALGSGLCRAIALHLRTKTQGWEDTQIILSLILLNIAGGTCVEDIERLEADEGLRTLFLKMETQGMRRKERREYERRWRKEKKRAFPSASTIHRYLTQFHQASEEALRESRVSFIPARNELLQKLIGLNSVLIEFAQGKSPCETATLDQDATLSSTHKRTALYCYEKYKAYQPFNTYWHEQRLLLHSEFRDGNVHPGFEQLRVLKECLQLLPEGVKKVYLRSDTAAYQRELLDYCARGEDPRFGVIEFAIGADVTTAFKAAVRSVKGSDWKPIYRDLGNGEKMKTDQEWAEVCYVPVRSILPKNAPDYRYIAIRESMSLQETLSGVEEKQQTLPFQTMEFQSRSYKLFGIITNRTIHGEELIHWYRQRCGDSERVHHVEKNELAGGRFPSQKFGANAAWWQIMVLAFNLNSLMKKWALPEKLKNKGMKALRFYVIGVAGQVVQHARGIRIKLSGGQETIDRICSIRQRIANRVMPTPLLSTG